MKFKIIRPDGSTKEFIAELNGNKLFQSNDRPYWNSRLLEKHGVTASVKKHNSYRKATMTERGCILCVGKNEDGSVVERIITEYEKAETERKRQNEFLRQRGYRWKKVWDYVGGDYDETEDKEGSNSRWELQDGNGKTIDDVDMLLAHLGFNGANGVAELLATRQIDAEKKAANKKAHDEKVSASDEIEIWLAVQRANKTGEYFPPLPTGYPAETEAIQNFPSLCFPGSGHDIYGTGTNWVITDTHIWKIDNNGMDGDDWSRNNCRTGGAGAIAVRYPRDERIVSLMQKHMRTK